MNPMKLIVLDRDGTINADRDDFVKSPDEWEPLPGALEAISRLNHAGWHTVIATNQSGLGRGLFDMGTLNAIHTKMNQMLAKVGGRIDAVFFCPHTAEEGCDCRKPAPGLFTLIGERFGVAMTEVIAVGDRLRDLQAGTLVGCQPHLVRTGKSANIDAEQMARIIGLLPDVQMHVDLSAFADFVIRRERNQRGITADSDSDFGGLD